ncbi:shikimate-5-dehydrogenase [Mycolicibacterium fortuitum subsp. acetamidolyticum]|uniref:Shikimate-5-dehydrogenase n=1 Tax=Mycolicibacterium fortuitum subsp. acetamidolyticum TaxID=144550 RepID=A0A124E3I0_MYCFO|nr:shikimate-5-dehydrogenase [Mycolicibacterium fortuitum subsp. acetamidolyticum]
MPQRTTEPLSQVTRSPFDRQRTHSVRRTEEHDQPAGPSDHLKLQCSSPAVTKIYTVLYNPWPTPYAGRACDDDGEVHQFNGDTTYATRKVDRGGVNDAGDAWC